MRAKKLDGCPSNSFLILLICLQCSDNDFGGGDVSSNVLYEPGGQGWLDLGSLFKMFVEYTNRSKKSIGGHKCVVFWYEQL